MATPGNHGVESGEWRQDCLLGLRVREHQTGVHRSLSAGGGLSQSVARPEEVCLRGFPDVTHAEILLAVVETSIFSQHFGGLPRGSHMTYRTGSPVGVSKGTVDVVHINSTGLSACWKTQTRPSLHGCTLLPVFLKFFFDHVLIVGSLPGLVHPSLT